MSSAQQKALRGRVLTFAGDPATDVKAVRYIEDGLVIIEAGQIAALGEASDLLAKNPGMSVNDHRPHLIMAGFVDTHLHFPQTQVIASYGAQLLEWLQKYTFVAEQKYADPEFASAMARFFLDELARNGTTTAAAYCSVHAQSAEALFAESARRNMRMIAGKVMMDRNAPAALTDTPQRGYDESKALIERWHGKGRQQYAISPRFAITSSDAQLEAAGALAKQFPDCHIQTHMDENHAEIAAVAELFPWSKDYAHVYEHFGLLGSRTLLGHCIHLKDRERKVLAETNSVAVFCPTSNLFLGSGLFDRAGLVAAGIRTGLATDIGGGTSYSMLRTAAEGYKVLQLQGQTLPAVEAFHMITRGNAQALALADKIGSLAPGMEADLVVLNAAATPAMAHRLDTVETLEEELFLLLTMGDERAVAATYVMGEAVAHNKCPDA